jgi:hypothetical protein
MGYVAGELGYPVPDEIRGTYKELRGLRKGRDLSSKEKAAYLEECLNPSKPIELHRRSPEVTLHI